MEKTRTSYWDNARGLLIFLVVLAHYYGAGFVYSGLSGGQWIIPQAIVSLIYLFHMPLFVFISGYFSRHAEKGKALTQLLLPYLVFNTLCILMDWFFLDSPLYNPVFYPYAHMWYLAALFLWRYFATGLKKLRGGWLWAIGFSLLCSILLPGKNWTLLANCITFLPFFLLGMQTGPETIAAVRRLPKWLCGGVLVLALSGALFLLHNGFTVYQLCFLAEQYSPDRSLLKQMAVTLFRYGTALVLGACVLNLIPEKTSLLTKLGRNTMTVFLLHDLPGSRNLLYLLDPFKGVLPLSMAWWTMWAVLATVLFGADRVMRVYQKIMDGILRLIPFKKETNI